MFDKRQLLSYVYVYKASVYQPGVRGHLGVTYLSRLYSVEHKAVSFKLLFITLLTSILRFVSSSRNFLFEI
jgi:hypothetical protein